MPPRNAPGAQLPTRRSALLRWSGVLVLLLVVLGAGLCGTCCAPQFPAAVPRSFYGVTVNSSSDEMPAVPRGRRAAWDSEPAGRW
ncbi:hypothetical protein ACQ4WX_47030 [Streptomyces lasalocidi]